MPKMGEMGNFWDQNQHFRTFFKIYMLVFSEIRPDDRH